MSTGQKTNKELEWEVMCRVTESGQRDNIERADLGARNFLMPRYRELRKSEISIYSKHMQALQVFINSEANYALILEDDIEIELETVTILDRLIKDQNIEFCDICESPGLSTQKGEHINVENYLCRVETMIPQRTRNACAYLISKKVAMLFLDDITHYVMPYDWALSYFLVEYGVNTKWVDGLPIRHGSQIGTYETTSKT